MRRDDPDLHLHAYVLSVTRSDQIGDVSRSQKEWEQQGVYFLNDSNWPERVLADVLAPAS